MALQNTFYNFNEIAQNMEPLMTIALLTAFFPILIVSGLISVMKQLINAFCDPERH
jgi:hypothetical protein